MQAVRLLTICVLLCSAAVITATTDITEETTSSEHCRGISDPEYLSDDGRTCYRSSRQLNIDQKSIKLIDARSKCSGLGGWLAYPRSEVENTVLKNIIKKAPEDLGPLAWTGLRTGGPSKTWLGGDYENMTDIFPGLNPDYFPDKWTRKDSDPYSVCAYYKRKDGNVWLLGRPSNVCTGHTKYFFVCAFKTEIFVPSDQSEKSTIDTTEGTTSSAACRGISGMYLSDDGNTCYRSSPQIDSTSPGANRATASETCSEMGGWLAYPRSAAEDQVLKNITNKDVKSTGLMNGYVWVGLWHVGGIWTGEHFEDLTDKLVGFWTEKTSDAHLCASYVKVKEGEVVLKASIKADCISGTNNRVAFICAYKTK